jgi:hypothetical protein
MTAPRVSSLVAPACFAIMAWNFTPRGFLRAVLIAMLISCLVFWSSPLWVRWASTSWLYFWANSGNSFKKSSNGFCDIGLLGILGIINYRLIFDFVFLLVFLRFFVQKAI